MTREEVLSCIELAQEGDQSAKELIVKNNLGLVWSIVHRFKNNYFSLILFKILMFLGFSVIK